MKWRIVLAALIIGNIASLWISQMAYREFVRGTAITKNLQMKATSALKAMPRPCHSGMIRSPGETCMILITPPARARIDDPEILKGL